MHPLDMVAHMQHTHTHKKRANTHGARGWDYYMHLLFYLATNQAAFAACICYVHVCRSTAEYATHDVCSDIDNGAARARVNASIWVPGSRTAGVVWLHDQNQICMHAICVRPCYQYGAWISIYAAQHIGRFWLYIERLSFDRTDN